MLSDSLGILMKTSFLKFYNSGKVLRFLWNKCVFESAGCYQPRSQSLSSSRKQERPWERGCIITWDILGLRFRPENVFLSSLPFNPNSQQSSLPYGKDYKQSGCEENCTVNILFRSGFCFRYFAGYPLISS